MVIIKTHKVRNKNFNKFPEISELKTLGVSIYYLTKSKAVRHYECISPQEFLRTTDVPLRCRLIRQSPDATVHTVVQ